MSDPETHHDAERSATVAFLSTRSWKEFSPVLDGPPGTPRIAVCAALGTRSAPPSCSPGCSGPGGRAVMVSALFGSIGGARSRSWRSRLALRRRGCSLEARARLPESAPKPAVAPFRARCRREPLLWPANTHSGSLPQLPSTASSLRRPCRRGHPVIALSFADPKEMTVPIGTLSTFVELAVWNICGAQVPSDLRTSR
jgi:hypothetical protein